MSLLGQFRGSEGVPGAFNRSTPVGAAVHGEVVDVTTSQAREYTTDGTLGELLTFQDGKPKMQYVVTIKNPELVGALGPDDDGRRRIYVKMFYRSDREALIAAVDAAGDDDVQVGGQFAAKFLGKGKDANGREAAWNVYKYEYRKPSALASALPAEVAPPAAQPTLPIQQPAAPAQDPMAVANALIAQQQAAAAPAAPAVDPATAEAVRTLITGGLSDNQIAGAFPGVKRELIAALRSVAG